MLKQQDLNIGDIVRTKKPHPCGCKNFKIISLGIDFKLECCNCKHLVIAQRQKALKFITKIESDNIKNKD